MTGLVKYAVALLLAAVTVVAVDVGPSQAAGPTRILTVGDSITAAGGWQAELDQILTANSIPHTITNVGVSGTRCDYWPSRIGALLQQYQPDLVVFACGTNDDVAATCFSEPCTSWAWRSVVEAVHTYRPGAAARVTPAFVQYSDPLIAPDWLLTSEPVTNDRLFRQWSRYPSAWFAGLVDLQQVPATADYEDGGGIHPTDRGHRVYGQLIYRAAGPAMGWPDTVPQPCGQYGHRKGASRPAYTPCP